MMLQRSVAAIAIVFGIVTVVAGGRVLSGADPGYPVFRPLLIFNVVMGCLYVLAGLRAWRDHRRGRAWAGGITLLNLLVLLAVLGASATGAGVASQSLAAMSVRTLVWGGLFLALSRVTRRADAFSSRCSNGSAAWSTTGEHPLSADRQTGVGRRARGRVRAHARRGCRLNRPFYGTKYA